MSYKLILSDQANKEIKELKKSEPISFKKLNKLLLELIENPYVGSGNPELLKHNYAGYYSRRISQKHRLIYSINDEKITVTIVSAKGHYGAK
ncbi:Txe/YoeB family addiction module toxin (plasmid) [Flavobacterium sp. TMP13]|uniref:Txe/YoeB family addiction module toxin n=1 Tax=Flavobacterium sp. TMP13 TaxID=3425950 RepID=UPI003D78672F